MSELDWFPHALESKGKLNIGFGGFPMHAWHYQPNLINYLRFNINKSI